MVVDTYVVSSLFDRGHLSIIVFSMAIGGMVQLISANGGMQGVVDRLSRLAHSPRSGQFVAWLLGVIIFSTTMPIPLLWATPCNRLWTG